MATLREKLDAALTAAGQPKPFVLTSLGGEQVWIPVLTPRQIREWWFWRYPAGKDQPIYDQRLVELWVRCCVDENGVPQYSAKDAEALRETKGGGAALAEFYNEARRRNFLFEDDQSEANERQRFFTQRAVAGEISRLSDEPSKDKPDSTKTETHSSG